MDIKIIIFRYCDAWMTILLLYLQKWSIEKVYLLDNETIFFIPNCVVEVLLLCFACDKNDPVNKLMNRTSASKPLPQVIWNTQCF